MELILCNTNLSVTSVVSLVMSNNQNQYIILTDQPNIEKFFKLLSLNNTELHYLSSTYSFFDIKLYQAKKWIKTIFANKEIKKIRIFHQAFGGFYNWIAYAASKQKIPVEYNRVLKDQQYPLAKFSLNVLKERLRYSVLFKTNVNILDRGNNTLMPKLAKTFYIKNNICEVPAMVKNEIIENVSNVIIKKMGFNLNHSSVVLLTGSIIATNQVKKTEYELKLKELLECVGKENIVCKCHPRFSDEVTEEKQLPHIPSFIPMEFLLPYFDVFIGYNSTVLNQVAQLGKTAISLVDYYIPINTERRDNWHCYLSKNVLFIKNIDELKSYFPCLKK